MIPTLAQVCSLRAPLEKDVEDYAAGACRSLELWFGKLDNYLEGHSIDEFRQLLARHEMTAAVASFQGGLLASQGEFRREQWRAFEARLDRCRDLGVRTIVLAADIPGPLAQQDLERVQMSLGEAAGAAGKRDIRLALEFQGRSAFCNNLQTAAALVAETASPYLGLCFDVFQYYVGPSKLEDLGYLSAENLFHVQLSDIAGQPRELVSDSDRVLPGDGDFQLEPVVERLRAIGYTGFVSVELMNPHIWQIPPRQFGEIAMTALRKTLGQAAMQ